jgi:hypothetical protein
MDRSVKAALISALVFPGAGHLFLKRAGRACLFMLPALVALAVFLGEAFEVASTLAGQILAGTLPADPVALAARIEQSGAETPHGTAAVVVLLVCWVCAAADAYLLGRADAHRQD